MGPIPQLPREFVVAAQRRRAVEAVAEITHEFGVGAITVSGVCRVARMGRATFYGLFGGLGDCRRYSFAEAYRHLFGAVAQSGDESDGMASVEAKIAELYAAVARDPLLAELCLVHCYAAPEESAGSDYEAGVQEFARLLAGTRTPDRTQMPFVDEFLAQAIVSLARSRLRQGRAGELISEQPEMVRFVAIAYGNVARP